MKLVVFNKILKSVLVFGAGQIKLFGFLFLFLLITNKDCVAQKEIDSLKTELSKTTNDTLKLFLLNELIEKITDDTIWPVYNEEMGRLAISILEGNDKLKNEASQKYMATYYNNLGYLQQDLGNLGLSLNFYYKSLSLYEKIDDKAGIANTLSNIGTIHNGQEEYKQALEKYKKSLEMRRILGDSSGMAIALNNMGSVYNTIGETEPALKYFEECIEIRRRIDDQEGLGITLTNIGGVYQNLGEDEKALDYYRQSMEVQKITDDQTGLALSFINFGTIFLKQGKYAHAESEFLKARQLAESTGSSEVMLGAARWLSKLYAAWGKYKTAFDMQVLYKLMTDSIRNDETKRITLKKQIQYDYDKKEAFLKAEQDKKDVLAKEEIARQKIIRNAVVGGLLLLMISSFVVLMFYKRKKEAEMQHKIADLRMRAINSQMNPHFIFNCMNSIQTLVLKKDFESADDCLVLFAKLIRKVLDNSTQKEISLQDDMDTLKDYVSLEKMRLEFSLDFNVKIADDIHADNVMIPPLLIQPIIENAIIHGIKPKNGPGTIMVEISKLQNLLSIKITDNGVGRKPDSGSPSLRKSYGIPLTRERLEYLGKEQKVKSSYKITDIYTSENESAGTKVILTLPLSNEFDS